MVIPGFVKRLSQVDDLNTIQANIQRAFNPLTVVPFLKGIALTDVVLEAGVELKIRHKLEIAPLGWILTDKTSEATIHRSSPSTREFLYLTSDIATTISLWVY